jgi:hypothetical protein
MYLYRGGSRTSTNPEHDPRGRTSHDASISPPGRRPHRMPHATPADGEPCFAAGLTFAAAVGDQVEFNATHLAGVPLHNAPGGTQTFQRVPSGTVATVIDTARDGRWVSICT